MKKPSSAVSIDEYLDQKLASFKAADLDALRARIGGLRAKMHQASERGHHDLASGMKRIIALLEASRPSSDPLPRHLAEAGVAAAYLLKGVDIIPDAIPQIGLMDDEWIVRRVLDRNPVLQSDADSV